MTINHSGIEAVELDTRGGDDRIAVRAISTRTTINTGNGSDTINVGTNATLGRLGQADTNTGGTLNDINASLTVNGQGNGDTDRLDLDDTADDSTPAHGTLTATTVTNAVRVDTTSFILMGASGSITYSTLESLGIHLGDAVNGNVFTVESTHGNGATTSITSGDGTDVFNIETLDGDLALDTGAGSDNVRVGSTTGRVDQIAGNVDAFDSNVNGIKGRLTVTAGTGTADTLKVYDGGDDARENARLTATTLTGMGMTLGVNYAGFEVLKVWLSNGDNNLYVASTHTGVTVIDTGNETAVVNGVNDVVNINSISGTTTVFGGAGNDIIRVNYDAQGQQTFVSGIDGELTLHGQAGSDLYEIGLAGQISSRINVFDQSRGDTGINRLRIYGTNQADFFLFRANKDIGIGVVAAIEVDANRLPVAGGVIERINYDADISGAVEVYGRAGDDTFVLDDNLAPLAVFGDAGADTFQIGQVYQSFRDGRNPANGLAEEDYFETTQITRGFLSNGISQSANLFGGTGNDTFTVYSNKAELFLNGDEDDDTFTVRAFVKVNPNDPKAPFTNINGGQGADFISFTVNAPVRIDGGDGFDTLTVIGTEFGDDFVVNDQGVYGAGLFVTYTGLERIVVDAIEGNDRFFIESTSAGVDLQIVGGLGSDTFHVGGSNGTSVTVVSNKLEGHSGLVIQTTTTDDPAYKNVFVKDVVADVRDNSSAGVVVLEDKGPVRVFERTTDNLFGLVVNSYLVVLTRAPEENVTISAVPVALTESVRKAGGAGVKLGLTDPGSTAASYNLAADDASENGASLVFTRDNWFIPQRVYVYAGADTLAEGTNGYSIVHRTQQGVSSKDGGAYDGLAVLGVTATVVDDDAASVLLATYDSNSANNFAGVTTPIVAEGGAIVGGGSDPAAPPGLQSDTYWVVLTKAPTGTVNINLALDGQTRITKVNGATYTGLPLTFTTSDWDKPQVVTVEAVNDTAREGTHYSRLTHTVDAGSMDYFLGVTAADIAAGLAGKVNGNVDSPFVATVNGNKVTIEGPAFRYELGRPYTQAEVTLGGTAKEGETWALVIDGKPWVYTVSASDVATPANALTRVAEGLRAAINGKDGLSAAVSGPATAPKITLTLSGGGLLTVSFLVSGSSAGIAALSGTQLGYTEVAAPSVDSQAAWTQAEVAIIDSGTPAPNGAVWTAVLDNTEFSYTRQNIPGTSPAQLESLTDVDLQG